MEPRQSAAAANMASLQQAIELIRDLDDATYRHVDEDLFGSSVGSHVRHLYEHYVQLHAGQGEGRIDYDARRRDPVFEQDRDYAMVKLKDMQTWLAALQATDRNRTLHVNMNCSGGICRTGNGNSGTDSDWSMSTVKRELQYLVMHDIHHYALIACLLHNRGFGTPPGFGIAPSTLTYRQHTCGNRQSMPAGNHPTAPDTEEPYSQ